MSIFNISFKNIFEFIKEYKLTFDITSEWFQDLWYPLSKNQPPQLGGLKKVETQPIIVTKNLLEWMGFKGGDLSDIVKKIGVSINPRWKYKY